MNLEKLREPFPAADIEWRIGRSTAKDGKVYAWALAYVTARAIQDRLDEVCSPSGWQVKYEHITKGVKCTISVHDEKLGWVSKEDGAEETDIEAFKGGISSAMKRAGSAWGIGRYLYKLDETMVATSLERKQGWNYEKSKDVVFYWETPKLPDWALPVKINDRAVTTEKVSVQDFVIPLGTHKGRGLSTLSSAEKAELWEKVKIADPNSVPPEMRTQFKRMVSLVGASVGQNVVVK